MELNDLIARCRANISERLPRPAMSQLKPSVYPDILLKFVAAAEATAAKVVVARSFDDVNKIVAAVYPDAQVIASALPYVSTATLDPDTVSRAADLNGTDVGIVEAQFGVAENGSVWIPQRVKERAVCFISENLVVVMPKSEIVNNMHEAYARLSARDGNSGADFDNYGYGVFMAGPSKTADIAQVLVNGAQAARSLTLVLVETNDSKP